MDISWQYWVRGMVIVNVQVLKRHSLSKRPVALESGRKRVRERGFMEISSWVSWRVLKPIYAFVSGRRFSRGYLLIVSAAVILVLVATLTWDVSRKATCAFLRDHTDSQEDVGPGFLLAFIMLSLCCLIKIIMHNNCVNI